eukprot:TRINITY_DN5557_c0_g2_i1.p1 TRINITY_DN5557_c0_g2~~TRINITY_DN5557_c0_g2_i1.p1  ORF type:complete len:823 (-),score=171.98 TRINITY_DN5557_c0_g2_i1:77-2545(-)
MAYRSAHAVNDLVLLEDISNAGIYDALAKHYRADEIYTYIGNVLISVNPFKEIPNLYGPGAIKKFPGKKEYQNPPHVYAVAERAFRNMVFDLENQCVIISGESGAGKTEASKKIMEYVAAMSSKSKQVQEVKEQLIQSNPLLEAFGNAKTIRNNNSSRFGKYMEMQFNLGDPQGGRITVYLLEKSRVIARLEDERSFHIFYQLLAGASESEKKEYGIRSVEEFVFLNQSKCKTVQGIDDAKDFQDTKKAMSIIGLSNEQQSEIFHILVGILHAGNIEFATKGSNSAVKNMDVLGTAAAHLKVPTEILEKALTNKTITTATESVTIPLNLEQSLYARDSLAKSVYGRLFYWLVDQANKAIKTTTFSTSLGVLDIYGFEIFGVNGFEQLCINFVNEKLHQLFIELTLKAEQEEYASEGIPWEDIVYYNNKPICELIEKRGGIFSLMDEECLFPKGTDTTFFEKLKKQLGGVKEFVAASGGKHSTGTFSIQHYAGSVTYETNGILDKNKDLLFIDIVQMMYKSSNSVASSLFEKEAKDDDNKKRPITTCVQFKNSVSELMDTLRISKQHYIRCIKPNESKRGGIIEEQLVLNQIQYLGLLENVKVRRAGYAFRLPYDKFISKYKCISKKDKDWEPDSKAGTTAILKEFGLEGDCAYGKTKIFIRSPKSVFALEEHRTKFLVNTAALIEKSHHDDIIFADKCFGFNKDCKRVGLTIAIAAQGVHVFDGKKLLHRAPMQDFSGITLPTDDGWMVLHLVFPPQKDEFLYLIENVYKAEIEQVMNVLKACNANLELAYSSVIPLVAQDPKEAKKQKAAAAAMGKKCIIL